MYNLAKIYIAFGMDMFWIDCWLVLQIVNEMFSSFSWKSVLIPECTWGLIFFKRECKKIKKNVPYTLVMKLKKLTSSELERVADFWSITLLF